ncbi:hypothetical protein QA639_21405 [Bradyrhizobium pachyrhizi]|nr:hypothetical protein [Bradyrhizobium pachyrhizi]WFU52268.1 hypothetical protein QA639_21405 [Bradyrhizobium pachyrhizi]
MKITFGRYQLTVESPIGACVAMVMCGCVTAVAMLALQLRPPLW